MTPKKKKKKSLFGSGCGLKIWPLSFLLWMLNSILCWLPIVLYLLILRVLTDWCHDSKYYLVALTCTYRVVFCYLMFTGSDFNRFIFVPIGVGICLFTGVRELDLLVVQTSKSPHNLVASFFPITSSAHINFYLFIWSI